MLALTSLEECKAWCVKEFPRCVGIEFSVGRCELWSRREGIAVTKPLSGFTCMRFGWLGFHLQAGGNRACRGRYAGDNADSNYRLYSVKSFEECRAMCVAARICEGFEFSGARCEVWIQPINAVSSGELSGVNCYKRLPESQLLLP